MLKSWIYLNFILMGFSHLSFTQLLSQPTKICQTLIIVLYRIWKGWVAWTPGPPRLQAQKLFQTLSETYVLYVPYINSRLILNEHNGLQKGREQCSVCGIRWRISRRNQCSLESFVPQETGSYQKIDPDAMRGLLQTLPDGLDRRLFVVSFTKHLPWHGLHSLSITHY